MDQACPGGCVLIADLPTGYLSAHPSLRSLHEACEVVIQLLRCLVTRVSSLFLLRLAAFNKFEKLSNY